MVDQREFQEIESMGEETFQDIPPQEVKSESGAGFLIFQAAVCLLLLFALVFLKVTDRERFQKVSGWYQQELSREIELPRWEHQQEETPADASLLVV